MKKTTKALMGFAIGIAATSCSQDDAPEMGLLSNCQTQEFEITCELPTGLRSRGADANGLFGDGKEATHLLYTIFKRDTEGNEETVYSSLTPGAPEPIRNADGTFTLKVTLTKTPDDEGKEGMYGYFLWADGYGLSESSPYKHYWIDGHGMGGTDVVSKDFSKSFGKYDRNDCFCLQASRGLCTIDFSEKFDVSNIKLSRIDMCQVCIVTPEFNDKPAGYESNFVMHFVETTDQNESGKFCITNTRSMGPYKRMDNYYLPVDRKIVPTDARITIDGKEMRYLYMDYMWLPVHDGAGSHTYGLYFNGKTVPVDLGTQPLSNKRIIIYPKEGKGFFNESLDFEFNIAVDNAFGSDEEIEI